MKDTPTPKHTAGPWKVTHGLSHSWVSGKDINIADVDWLLGETEQKANAELIARAPELLEENERLKNWLWQYREELKSTNVYHVNQGLINAINKLLPEVPSTP